MHRIAASKWNAPRRPVETSPSGASSFPHPRHECVAARALVAGIVVAAFGCSTTHQLGRASEAATVDSLAEAAELPGARVHVEPLASDATDRAPASGYPVRRVADDGLELSVAGPPVVVPLDRVRSVSRLDRKRGALEGALAAGIPAVVVTAVVGGIWLKQEHDYIVSDGTPFPNPAVATVVLSAGVGIIAALIGGGVGAFVGHEDRYVVAGD